MNLHIDQQQRTAQAENAVSTYLDGTTDAAFGTAPQSLDPAYLDGFFAGLRERVEAGEQLQIRWLSSAFLSGGYDSPDEI